MRDVLIKRVRPLVEQLAADLVDVTVARIELELERMAEMFDVALSAYASDNFAPNRAPRADAQVSGHAVSGGQERDCERVTAGETAPIERDTKPANARKPNTCSKCGFIGGTAQGCGRSHKTVQAPSAPAPAAKPAALSSADRKELIARSVSRIEPAKPTLDDDDDDEHLWSPERLAEEKLRAESRKLGGELPIPRSTWEF